MTVILRESDDVKQLITRLKFSLEEFDNYMQTWKSNSTFQTQSEAEAEMIVRMEHNSELEFRIIKVTTDLELVVSSKDINLDTVISTGQDGSVI